MFVEERLEIIRNLVKEKKHVDVKSLADVVPASIATIRRDIDSLENQGFLVKYHGGVSLKDPNTERASQFSAKKDVNLHRKAQVAKIAAGMIRHGDIIFIGAGNTCWEIAKRVKDLSDLTVMTNSFLVVSELAALSNIKLVFLGGDVETENGKSFTSGSFAKEILRSIYIQKTFITVNGVSLDYGYSINNHYLTDIYTTLLAYSRTMTIVADSTKLGNKAFRHLCDLGQGPELVTNGDIPPDYRRYFEEKAIPLYLAD